MFRGEDIIVILLSYKCFFQGLLDSTLRKTQCKIRVNLGFTEPHKGEIIILHKKKKQQKKNRCWRNQFHPNLALCLTRTNSIKSLMFHKSNQVFTEFWNFLVYKSLCRLVRPSVGPLGGCWLQGARDLRQLALFYLHSQYSHCFCQVMTARSPGWDSHW